MRALAALTVLLATSTAWILPRGHQALAGSHYGAALVKPSLPKSRCAVAVLSGGFGATPGVSGMVTFEQNPSGRGMLVRGQLSGLPRKACLAMHIHEGGNLAQGCVSVGDHWNPFNVKHGPPTEVSHAGDFGNLITDSAGTAEFSVTNVMLASLTVNDVLGRAFVVHERMDDLGYGGHPLSLKNGNSGRRIACGVIGRV